MIQLSPRVMELLSNRVIETFFLIKIGNIKVTSYSSDLTVEGTTYGALGVIYEVDNLQSTSTVDRDLYKIHLVDSDMSLKAAYETNMVGAPVEVRVGFVDQVSGLPELNHTIVVYKGIVESFDYQIETSSDGRIISEIVCSNPMADLDAVNPFYSSKDFIKQLNPDDSAFDQVYIGSGILNLRWGKK